MRVVLLAAIIIIIISGCSDAPPLPTDHFYRLTVGDHNNVQLQNISDTIYIAPFKADGIYNERAMLYANSPDGRELQQHHYHFWITSPPDLLRDYLVDYLRNVSSARIIQDNIRRDGIRILGRVQAFEILKTDSGDLARVRIEFTAIRRNDTTPVLVKSYLATEKVNGDTFDEKVNATNTATDHIYQELIQDLNQI